MISSISAATNGLHAALAQLDRAAEVIATKTQSDVQPDAPAPSIPSGPGELEAIVEVIAAPLAFNASLQVVRATYTQLAEAIRLGGYDTTVDPDR
jgi:hypothetical protein